MSKPKTQKLETFTSTADAAAYIGLSRDTFVRNVLPEIPHRFVGRRYVISKRVLRDWLETGPGK